VVIDHLPAGVNWDGDNLTVTPPTVQFRPLDLRMAREQDPRIRAGVYRLLEQPEQEAAGESTLQPPQPGDLDAEDLPPGWRPPEPPD
jgi:hypothetical protein